MVEQRHQLNKSKLAKTSMLLKGVAFVFVVGILLMVSRIYAQSEQTPPGLSAEETQKRNEFLKQQSTPLPAAEQNVLQQHEANQAKYSGRKLYIPAPSSPERSIEAHQREIAKQNASNGNVPVERNPYDIQQYYDAQERAANEESIATEKAKGAGKSTSRSPNEQSKSQVYTSTIGGKSTGTSEKTTGNEKLRIEVVDEPLINLFRMIAKTYKINLVPQVELKDQKITIHLEDISIDEGLRVICEANGLALQKQGDVYYIKKATDETISRMYTGVRKMDIEVENQEVKSFIRDFSAKTGISIAPGQNLSGKVTGHLKQIAPIDGFKALMLANNFDVRKKGGVYIVESPESATGADGSPLGYNRRGMMRGNPMGNGNGTMDIDVHEGNVSMSLKNADLGEVMQTLIDQADLNMISYGKLDGLVDAEIKDMPLEKALNLLLQGTRFTYVMRDGMIMVGDKNPNSPSGGILSTAELINLKYVRVDKILAMLPKNISPDGIKEVKEQNAILATGTSDYIVQVKEFLEQVDLPVPQVMLEVLIVEYDRNKNSKLGVENLAKDKIPTGSPRALLDVQIPGFTQTFKPGEFSSSVHMLGQDFYLNLASSLSDDKGKVLAMPKITTLNGNKATLQVASTQYFPVQTFNQEGIPSTDFRAISDGITIDITPWVTKYGDVNLQIIPTIKNAKPPIVINNTVSPGDVSDRSINTNVRLMDGETLILGGLINTREDNNRVYVPILGHIPILGYLFSYRSKSSETKELVIFVTPHILTEENRGVNLKQELERMDERAGKVKGKDFSKSGGNSVDKKNVEKNTKPSTKQKPKQTTDSNAKSSITPTTTTATKANAVTTPKPVASSSPTPKENNTATNTTDTSGIITTPEGVQIIPYHPPVIDSAGKR